MILLIFPCNQHHSTLAHLPLIQDFTTAAAYTMIVPIVRFHLCGGSTNLSTIDRMINNSDVLNNTSDKIWVLNANVSVENGATLFINSTDALWLKIKSSPYYPHSIVAYGNLVMNGTKISSWIPSNNTEDALKKNANVSIPRSYLLVPQEGTGQMNITNSNISELRL